MHLEKEYVIYSRVSFRNLLEMLYVQTTKYSKLYNRNGLILLSNFDPIQKFSHALVEFDYIKQMHYRIHGDKMHARTNGILHADE